MTLAIALALAITASPSDAAWSQTGLRPQIFNIPSQSVESSLREFARQAGIEVLFTGQNLAKLTSKEVAGAVTRGEAIASLVEDAGLIIEFE